jgi:hypothetical protein
VNEADWTACRDPAPMLRYLEGLVSDATFRFFLVGCCRRLAHQVRDQRSRDAIEVGESFARGIASPDRLAAVREAAEQAVRDAEAAARRAEARVFNAIDAEVWRELSAAADASRAAAGVVAPQAKAVVLAAASAAADAAATDAEALWEAGREQEQAAQCELLRELVGWPIHSAIW